MRFPALLLLLPSGLMAASPPAAEAAKPELGTSQYIERIAGGLPVIIGAPHGGTLKPAGIPDRTAGMVAQDSHTQELARMIREEMQRLYGAAPHLIVCRLHRLKVDCNREIKEAAQGNAGAERAFHEFHAFIARSRAEVEKEHGCGLYIDLHGHRHEEALVEIGSLVPAAKLGLADAELDAGSLVSRMSSIRELDARSPQPFSALLRGPQSLGGLLQAKGFPSIPSPAHPSPGSKPYYNGAYDISIHGSRSSGTVSALQVECPFAGLRDKAENRRRFAKALSEALGEYFKTHFGMELKK